eukprot:6161566-Amphidinium_carterae.1
MARQAAAKAREQSREMSLPRVAENDVMEMDVSSPTDLGGVSYASVTIGASSASSSGWTDWQADVRPDGDSDPRVKALPGR